MTNNFGEKLRKLRDMFGYKQEFVSAYIGLTQSSYSRIENSEGDNISLKQIKRFAELYKISPEQLFIWDGNLSITKTEAKSINFLKDNFSEDNSIVMEERIKNLEYQLKYILDSISNKKS